MDNWGEKIKAERKINVSIIIVSHLNAPILKLCLAAIVKNITPTISYEIIVVDNESKEEIPDLILEEYPQVKLIIFKKNVGFAKALNRGIKEARGETILSLNPDILIKKGAIEELYDYVIKHKEVGIAGPKLLNFNGSRQISTFSFYTPITVIYRRTFLGNSYLGRRNLKKFIIKPKETEPQSIEGWLMGSALMLRSDNIKEVGLMDERYFMYFEDVDWCRRFKEANYQIVYIPLAEMFHYHGKMSASKSIFGLVLNRMTAIHFLSGLKYFLKFRGWKVRIKKESA